MTDHNLRATGCSDSVVPIMLIPCTDAVIYTWKSFISLPNEEFQWSLDNLFKIVVDAA